LEMSRENSDVLPAGSVAVVVKNWPTRGGVDRGTEKLALPEPSVVTPVWPRYCWPSPKPEGSGAALAKNWTVKVALGVLLSAPERVVVPPDEAAAVRVG